MLHECHESEYSKFLKSLGIDKEKMLADMESRLSEDERNRLRKMRLERIEELEKEKCELLGIIQDKDKAIQELQQQIEKMKSQYDYAFNQLCKSREILCSMLSQYRYRKEIDYSTRECGEKLLKQGVCKND